MKTCTTYYTYYSASIDRLATRMCIDEYGCVAEGRARRTFWGNVSPILEVDEESLLALRRRFYYVLIYRRSQPIVVQKSLRGVVPGKTCQEVLPGYKCYFLFVLENKKYFHLSLSQTKIYPPFSKNKYQGHILSLIHI